jgi:hypothetical protein
MTAKKISKSATNKSTKQPRIPVFDSEVTQTRGSGRKVQSTKKAVSKKPAPNPAKKVTPKMVIKNAPVPKKTVAKNPVKMDTKKVAVIKPTPKKMTKTASTQSTTVMESQAKNKAQSTKKVVSKKLDTKAVKEVKTPRVDKATKATKIKEPKTSKRDVVMSYILLVLRNPLMAPSMCDQDDTSSQKIVRSSTCQS